MTDHELERRIRTAVEHATPDRLDCILSSCDQQNHITNVSACKAHADGSVEGEVIHMSEMKQKNTMPAGVKRGLAAIAAIAAMFVLCFTGYQLVQRQTTPMVDSVITLDVNPSLSMRVDADETVLAAEALNDDANEILGSMELEGTSLEVAVNAIIGSMLQKGYLGDMQNTILVTVENPDAVRGAQLQQKVASAITRATQSDSLDAAILSQLVSADDAALAELAQQYGISIGKASLIQEVIAQVPTLTFADLAPMTINEISLIAASKNVSSESVTQNGTASDKAYINQSEALELACNHAGIAAEDVVKMEVEFDSEHGTMVYEVAFETANQKCEYEIDARTGEILKSDLKNTNSAGEILADIGAAAAKEIALTHAGVTAEALLKVEVELDTEDHTPVYKLEFETSAKKCTYKINATTGEIISYDTKNLNDTTNSSKDKHSNTADTSASSVSYIGEAAAKEAALTHAGVTESDTAYVKCYLDYDNGKPACYCVEFQVGSTEYEYEIDLYSGAVLDVDVETHENSGGHNSAENAPTSGSDAYIGESAALAAALEHAGVAESSLTEKYIELVQKDYATFYKVVFKADGREYRYEIDALNGQVLKSPKR